jgi:hypothetical protein
MIPVARSVSRSSNAPASEVILPPSNRATTGAARLYGALIE